MTNISKICNADGCNKKLFAKGLCKTHYERIRLTGSLHTKYMTGNTKCSVEGCNNKYHARGFCSFHYGRFWNTGDTKNGKPRRSSETRNANGSGHVTSCGYKVIMIDKISKFEHVLVVEKAMGKPLPKQFNGVSKSNISYRVS